MTFAHPHRQFIRSMAYLAVALGLTLLSGCSMKNLFGPAGTARLEWKGLLVSANSNANQNTAVALDIVFVGDPEMLEKLSALPASRWFAVRDDQLKTYPTALSVHSLELVPGQSRLLSAETLGSPRVAGVLLFANYQAPGEHRLRLPPVPDGGLVILGERSFTVTEHRL